MSPEPAFRGDTFIVLTRKCIVFPADGSKPRIVDMTIRTVTTEDISNAKIFNRTVDLLASYGSEYRKMRSWPFTQSGHISGKHQLYFNLSPKLPLNRCVARIVGLNPDNIRSELFWRGDVVVMKYKSQDDIFINCQNANASAIIELEEYLRDAYYEGRLEKELALDEWAYETFHSNSLYWGKNCRREEADFLNDINELKELCGYTISVNSSRTHPYTGWLFSLLGMGLAAILKTLQTPNHIITGPPTLPRNLERRVFETCARNYPETSSKLMLVAPRVRDWIRPILFETVILNNIGRQGQRIATRSEHQTIERKPKFELFMANLDREHSRFYAGHVKNLWITAPADPDAFERILMICSSVENLVLFPNRQGLAYPFIPFLEHPGAGGRLRRLTVKLEYLFPPWSSMGNFNHPCFANLTHLHLYDEAEEWSRYTGFEQLRSLTHFAVACCTLEALAIAMPKLPALQYVALCHYESNRYERTRVWNNRVARDVYDIRVVWLTGLTERDWERGARGGGDFWEIVEREVTNRRAKMVRITDENSLLMF